MYLGQVTFINENGSDSKLMPLKIYAHNMHIMIIVYGTILSVL